MNHCVKNVIRPPQERPRVIEGVVLSTDLENHLGRGDIRIPCRFNGLAGKALFAQLNPQPLGWPAR